MIPGIIGARLYHVLDKWDYYLANWPQIWQFWQGGLGIFGGIFGGIVGLLIYKLLKLPEKLKFLNLLDFLIPSLALGQTIGRWGNFVNQEAFGPPTSLPWGIYIQPQNRPDFWIESSKFHPVFFYESLLMLGAVLVLLMAEKRFKMRRLGAVSGLYFLMYGITRMVIEPMRFDTAHIYNIPTAEVLSAGLIFIGLFLLNNSKICGESNVK